MEDAILENVWKFIFILSVSGFMYFLNKYTSKIEKSIEKLTDGFNEISALVKMHEHRLDDHQEEIREIKQMKVRYTK